MSSSQFMCEITLISIPDESGFCVKNWWMNSNTMILLSYRLSNQEGNQLGFWKGSLSNVTQFKVNTSLHKICVTFLFFFGTCKMTVSRTLSL